MKSLYYHSEWRAVERRAYARGRDGVLPNNNERRPCMGNIHAKRIMKAGLYSSC